MGRRVYVFGSAAYLTALAVTVLIVYLMNPPVSDAIQGAFFVAAFFTGVIFGVLSLVFADITEGFGCLLGGFCLSMWFLSVKDGGLITSGTGRAIFIGCMSAGGYSLAFSHYTRNYGLIASIAFSGATAAILGIDCLAGSGWKEFWLYLWSKLPYVVRRLLLTSADLNDDIFPLNTDTYPVTKNIKAELAGVVIIAVVSIVSQMRVWKMVKEHRVKTAAQQLERQADQDREEEEQGRIVEDNFQKERAQWEAAYGNGQNVPEASIRSSTSDPKDLTLVQEKEVSPNDSAVTVNMPAGMMQSASNNTKSGATVTVGVLDDDAIQQIEPEAHAAENEKALLKAPKDDSKPTLVKSNSLRPTAPPPPPAVVPLPFKVPTEEEAHSDNDNTSVSAIPETDHDVEVPGRLSKRVSDVSAMRQRISRDIAASQEALIGTRGDEDDRASSIAATLNDDLDVLSVRSLSPVESPIGTEHDNPFEKPGLKRQDSDTVPDRKSVVNTVDVVKSLTTSTDPKTADSPKEQSFERRADTVMSSSKASSEKYSKSTKSDELSQGSQLEQGGSQVGSPTENVMPEKLSKIALSYRTNEWAKHLETAEKPDYEDMFLPSSPGVMLADGSEEKATPVSDELLYESKRESRRMSTGSRTQRNSSQGLRRNTSTFSQESLVNQRSLTHSPSIASPQVLSRSNSAVRLDTLSPLPSNTLLSKREGLIKNRASALTLIPQMSSPNLSQRGDDEDMTLAQRRQLLQQQQLSPSLSHQPSLRSPGRTPPSTSQKWQNKAWAAKGAPTGFDSHQPKRSSSAQSEQKREQLYAGWRDTMRDIAPPQQTAAHVVEQQRAALLMERRQKELEKQQRDMMQQQRASQMDSMMRSGQMIDAHREAMRKMQANANRHT
ncbi:hypothetical protein J4E90_002922 [Alternaria incomplexa]|uniref:uncharacterized protein n=1 Tax=Alternaria incomplexa TaxID=1187928 RepID=UPI00221ECB06|nr:uncharacterized protein J4E90_002922 [Alternaria incomplexa]KAI4918536.1 hypothetical protein J4E90_002922 [Alternaria incomplexa]